MIVAHQNSLHCCECHCSVAESHDQDFIPHPLNDLLQPESITTEYKVLALPPTAWPVKHLLSRVPIQSHPANHFSRKLLFSYGVPELARLRHDLAQKNH